MADTWSSSYGPVIAQISLIVSFTEILLLLQITTKIGGY